MSIKIDYDEIKENVQGLTDAAEACVAEEMDPEDTKTTIKANSACRISFNKSQNLMELLGETLAGDAKNIESMGNTFQAVEPSLGNACMNE